MTTEAFQQGRGQVTEEDSEEQLFIGRDTLKNMAMLGKR